MTEQNTMADIPTEGNITIPEVEADNTATDSPAETKDTEKNPAAEGEDESNTPQDEAGDDPDIEDGGVDADENDTGEKDPEKIPFHEHPRWKQREEEWDKRFNEQEERHQSDLQKLREEFSKSEDKKSEELESDEMPDWFGGTEAQWKQFKAWNQQQLESAQNAALKKVETKNSAKEQAIAEATKYFQSELRAIESDPILNPNKGKINPTELLKTAMDNELIDTKGQWNYRAAYQIMKLKQSTKTATKKPAVPNEKKKLAGAITSEPKGETQPKNFKTNEDFKKKQPW